MHKRRSINGGIIMITVGVIFLLLNMFPSITEQLNIGRQWPLLIIVVGLFFLLSALFRVSDMAIPGSIVLGIGCILYYQNLTGNWASWAYAWTLIPGFVGIGLLLSAVLGSNQAGQQAAGFRLLLISAVLFIIFAFFFVGGLGQFWPVLLILLGVWLLIRNRFPNLSP